MVGEAYNRAGQAGAAKAFNKLFEALQHEAIIRMGYRQRRQRLRLQPDAAGDRT